MAHGSGRDPGLCAPVIWEMRKMRRRRRRKRGKATEWCSFQNKFPRVERGAEREIERSAANQGGFRFSRIMKNHNFSVLNLQNIPFRPASLTSSEADRQGVSIGHTIERTLNFEFEILGPANERDFSYMGREDFGGMAGRQAGCIPLHASACFSLKFIPPPPPPPALPPPLQPIRENEFYVNEALS